MQAYLKVLVLSSDPETHFLTETLAPFADVTRVESISETLALVEAGDCNALFCEWDLADGTWRTVLEELHKRRQEIPVIVFRHCSGESEWIEVLEGGAFDLLVPPYSSYQMLAVLEHALACGHRIKGCSQYAVGA